MKKTFCKRRDINSHNCQVCKKRFQCWTQDDKDPTLLATLLAKYTFITPNDILITWKATINQLTDEQRDLLNNG